MLPEVESLSDVKIPETLEDPGTNYQSEVAGFLEGDYTGAGASFIIQIVPVKAKRLYPKRVFLICGFFTVKYVAVYTNSEKNIAVYCHQL